MTEDVLDPDAKALKDAATALSVLGIFNETLSNYYQLEGQRNLAESEALTFGFRASMLRLNADSADRDASSILRAGNSEVGRLTLAAGQERGAGRVRTAAQGIRGSSRSAIEARAAERLRLEIDKATLRANSLRASNQARLQGVDLRSRAEFADLSARSRRSTRRSIIPALGAFNTLLDRSDSLVEAYKAFQE